MVTFYWSHWLKTIKKYFKKRLDQTGRKTKKERKKERERERERERKTKTNKERSNTKKQLPKTALTKANFCPGPGFKEPRVLLATFMSMVLQKPYFQLRFPSANSSQATVT